jgi:decaprenylphospho-beta-D-erythro-pentofuranosid-2-ulose 2-reductase
VSAATTARSSGKRVLVIGGTSEIAAAIVGELQRRDSRELALVGRDAASLARRAEELGAAGERALTYELDALDLDRHGEVLARAFTELGGADIVLLAVGELGERGGLPDDIAAGVRVLQVNLLGAGSLLMHAARELRERGGGTLVVLSSVAAERPRRANAIYGASKAGLDALAQGLADDLRDDGVRILVVRPGFVRTRMTAGLEPAPLATTPEAVATAVLDGLDGKADTVWAPPRLRLLMLVMKMIPRPLFRRIER